MADTILSQAEADSLISMDKLAIEEKEYVFPSPGERITIPLASADKREAFILDVSRSRIDLAKVTNQNRARQVVVLMRLDLGGAPHRNPDDVEIPCPHLHVYREGYGDKWAIAAPPHIFTHLTDIFETFSDFMQHCNVIARPSVRKVLF